MWLVINLFLEAAVVYIKTALCPTRFTCSKKDLVEQQKC